MKCPDCQIELTPTNLWRVKLPDKTFVSYGILPEHKRGVMTLYGMMIQGGELCDWGGFAVTIDPAKPA